MRLEPIIQAVRQAALLCASVQAGQLQKVTKEGAGNKKEPVTIADYGSQAIICRAIAEHFPDDAVVAEEAGQQFMALTTPEQKAEVLNHLNHILDFNVIQDEVVRWMDHGSNRQSPRTWVIDPIDGTKGFIANRHYAIGVGIMQDGIPVGAVMGCPGYADGAGVLFVADEGRVTVEPLSGGEQSPVKPAPARPLEQMIAVQSVEREHASAERMARVRELAGLADIQLQQLDSMSKYAMVAAGDADVYLRLPNLDNTRPHMSWDHVPGVVLVNMAGGMATDIDGSPLDFSDLRIMKSRGVIASSGGELHERLVKAVGMLLAEEASE